MKCRSLACIWSETPPSGHKVTASAVLRRPPTLFTAGSDGSIFSWSLFSSSSSSSSEIRPVAMLCGHTAPVADLSICHPMGGDVETDHLSGGALISVCTDGVMCVWSTGSGHCRLRRKLPPWVGAPCVVRTLPMSPRYVCIGCSFFDAQLYGRDSVERQGVVLDRESWQRKPSKCTVVIVDTYSLTIVQIIVHGNLAIGPLRFMDLVLLGEDGEKHSVLLADSFGGVQLIPILKESNLDAESGNRSGLQSSSQLEVDVWGNELNQGEQIISISRSGNLVALVFENCCVFRLLKSNATVGEISFVDGLFGTKGNSPESPVSGCMFLENGDDGNMRYTQQEYESSWAHLAIWNSKGYAVVYEVSYLSGIFKCEVIGEIPPVSHPIEARMLISFTQLNSNALRIESHFSDVEESLQCKPRVTIWSLNFDSQGEPSKKCKMLGESDPFAGWISGSVMFQGISGDSGRKIPSFQSSIPSTADEKSYRLVNKRKAVSSSMVISKSLIVPFAVVYGFFSGEIEVVHFDLFPGPHSCDESPHLDMCSRASRQYLLGHTGPVLCLAAHTMLGTANGWSFNQVLVSGSMDCTIRIWDLDSGDLITVMHQHVAPVRQIIFPPPHTPRPWSDCFLSVGEDSCVALASLETLHVERMFPGNPSYPEKLVWDGVRGYIACLCRSYSGKSDSVYILYIWDVKTGARERVLRGNASHAMFDHFCKGINANSVCGSILNGNTSVSVLNLPIIEDGSFSPSHHDSIEKKSASANMGSSATGTMESTVSQIRKKEGISTNLLPIAPSFIRSSTVPVRCSCPFPGIASLTFDLGSLMLSHHKQESVPGDLSKQENIDLVEQQNKNPSMKKWHGEDDDDESGASVEENDGILSLEEHLLRFSLSFLHLWGLDLELDKLLVAKMKLKRPEHFLVAAGLQGDKGSLTLTFPGLNSILELWKSSSEFVAMRSLTMVSIAQRMIRLSHSSAETCSALAAFYTRHFSDKYPDIKSPSLQLLVSFWQDESEHVRMAARTLFHCSASRAIPPPLCGQKVNDHVKLLRSLNEIEENENEVSRKIAPVTGLASEVSSESEAVTQAEEVGGLGEKQSVSEVEESKILEWLEPFEMQDWISCVGGMSQDAMTSHIIVAAALAVWYPSLVKPSLPKLVVHPLIKLVMAVNDKYSSTAAELLAEGMENTWKLYCGAEIQRLIGDIFFQIECVSGQPANSGGQHLPISSSIRETLVGILLPSLAMADILGFLTVIESQIWSTASDSPVHLVSIATLIRVVRGSPKCLIEYLDKVVNFILHTLDPGNLVMRQSCIQGSMTALKEVVRVFPMVALNDTSTKLAVGDAIGEISNATISVYDMQSVTKIKVLDASGPPGLPILLSGGSGTTVTTLISALSFSPDGEGLVAFSENGLMIRWWSLGSIWWEKLSRNFSPVHCTKLIFVPPWEGISPKSSRLSIMENMIGRDGHALQSNSQETARVSSHADSLKHLIHNLELSYRLEWVGERKVLLKRQGLELGTFPI